MKRESVVAVALLLIGVVAIAAVHFSRGTSTGQGWYELRADQRKISLTRQEATQRLAAIDADAKRSDSQQAEARASIQFSLPRTVGIWIAAFFTLAVLSFLYRDNPFYRIAEHAFIGVSAAFWMTIGFWNVLVPNLFGKLFPAWLKFGAQPGLNLDEVVNKLATESWSQGVLIDYEAAGGDGLSAPVWQLMDLAYLIPLVLGVMLLWRLAPRGGWIARWPLAMVLGTTAGIRLTGFLESDFIKQIQATIVPLYAPVYDSMTGALDVGRTFYESLNNSLLVLGVTCGLVYFFFSVEHRGIVGRVSKVGIWVLMITFGAGFGYTVMGRIAMLVNRFQFLVSDWLNVVPRG